MGKSDETSKELVSLINDNSEILNVIYSGVLIIDLKGTIVYCNPAAHRIINKTFSDIIGKNIEEINNSSLLYTAIKEDNSYENTLIQFEGKSILTSGTTIKKNGQKIGGVSIFHDVKDFEDVFVNEFKVIQDINRELNAIIESSYDGIWISDGKGVTLRVNKSYEDFAGIKAEEVVGHSLYDLVGEGYVTDSAALRVIENKAPVTLIHEIRTGKKAMVTAKPIWDENGEIWRIITNVRDISLINNMREEIERLRQKSIRDEMELKQLRKENLHIEIIGSSIGILKVVDFCKKVADVDSTVLLLGESGVGKDVFARLIHKCSPRKEEPFVKINCGAIPDNLIESELFGYEKGSFTGANISGKLGMFEMADGGTLFLDEVGELPLRLQVKLLQAIQECKFYKVGGTQPIKVNVRILAATNRDLISMIREGTFRKDLYYRLNVVSSEIPPLRERREDIPLLVKYFLNNYNNVFKIKKIIDADAMKCLIDYDWPGNIRELENIIEGLVVLTRDQIIKNYDLPKHIQKKALDNSDSNNYSDELTQITISKNSTLNDAIEVIERKILSEALIEHGSTRQVAKLLNVDQSTIVRKAQKYNIKWAK
ncbi:MAG: hypothetical protein APF76_15075 [Desulfitibacter sp. BRH_c19]|nr:MAG: hypothetical protein APF76_15075 [Desulfitibacter sp. BRH_c19]